MADVKDARIRRGDKSSNVPGSLTFIGLRGLDPFLQHAILANNVGASLITTLGGRILNQGPTSNTGYAAIDGLNLSPYRLVILAMACGSSFKHAVWKAFIGKEHMDVPSAAGVSLFNTIFNSLNSLFFICQTTSPAYGRGEGPYWSGWPGAHLTIGAGLFTVGILTELVSEFQRKVFKDRPENKGKVYTGGLFGLARHINYTGYTLWRMGYATACGGYVWGAFTGAFFFYDFAARGVETISAHCERNYGDMWHDYCSKTPYVLIPGLY